MDSWLVESARRHEELIDLLKKYAISIGRAEVVEEWEKKRDLERAQEASEDIELKAKSQIFVPKDCDDGSRPEEDLVVPSSDEAIVKFPTKLVTTEISMVPTKPTLCASSYGDIGCSYDSEEDENVFEYSRSTTKEDKDEQGKEEKGVVNFFEVGIDEQNYSHNVLYNVGGTVYGMGKDTWADVGLKHGFIKNSKIYGMIPIHMFQHVELFADWHEKRVVQRRIWDPGITQDNFLKQHLEDKVFFLGAE